MRTLCRYLLTALLIVLPLVSFASDIPAPELPANLEWLNVDKPLTLKSLRGKYVLLDFWTYCCINCLHIIPDLKKLEEKYPDYLVVIGVHSAKFTNEGVTQNIREAILRHELKHPVVNDPELLAWRAYNVEAWPTIVLIGPDGNIITSKAGEGIFNLVDSKIQQSFASFSSIMDPKPIALSLEMNKRAKSILSFPGKVIVDGPTKRIFIADSGHNRILITSLDGEIQDVIGSGEEGDDDGQFSNARFFHPQGLAYSKGLLYVADTENHLIRKVDFSSKTVSTIAGIGIQSNDRQAQGKAIRTALSSPWDLTLIANKLYVAMAGIQQIWVMDLDRGSIAVFAGSGREDIIDGFLNKAALAQTSGITNDGQKLYFVDSETSSVRMSDTDPLGQVKTIIGTGLFEFGDADGDRSQAKFQHPLGIAYNQGVLYIADTYNNKIKQVDPISRSSQTIVGPDAGLNEPGGLAFADGSLYIADTNNNQITVLDIKTGKINALVIRERAKGGILNPQKFKGEKRFLGTQGPLKSIELDLQFANGYELLVPNQSSIRIYNSNGEFLLKKDIEMGKTTIPIAQLIDGRVYIELTVYYCRHGQGGICLFKNILYELPIDAASSSHELKIDLTLGMK